MPEGSPGSGWTQTVLPFEAAGAEFTVPSHAELDVVGGAEPADSHQQVAATSNVATTASTTGFHELRRAGTGVLLKHYHLVPPLSQYSNRSSAAGLAGFHSCPTSSPKHGGDHASSLPMTGGVADWTGHGAGPYARLEASS